MDSKKIIYVLGSGAVGFPLAAHLVNSGRKAIAVRTSRDDIAKQLITIDVHNVENRISVPVQTVSLAKLDQLEGIVVIAVKSYVNEAIALQLKSKSIIGPIVIMQNGVGVEQPFIEAGMTPIYRCILYVTSQTSGEYEFITRPITASPIGIVAGDELGLKECVKNLDTDNFPFRAEANIQREIWKKAIVNSVFNSICPLLDIDNGIFARDVEAEKLAQKIVKECMILTDRLAMNISEGELMGQIMKISKASHGQLISTLQDIKAGRQTEIEFLNLAIARIAAAMQPSLQVPVTELLGKMILIKSMQQIEKLSQKG